MCFQYVSFKIRSGFSRISFNVTDGDVTTDEKEHVVNVTLQVSWVAGFFLTQYTKMMENIPICH
jgi:hypothetical protein